MRDLSMKDISRRSSGHSIQVENGSETCKYIAAVLKSYSVLHVAVVQGDSKLTLHGSFPREQIIEDYDGPNDSANPLLGSQTFLEPRAAGFWSSVWNLWNDILGGGIVAIPWVVASLGIWLSPPVFILCAAMNGFTLNILYKLSIKHRQTSYQDLCYLALGTPGYVVMCFLMFVLNFGGLVANLMIVGANVPDLLKAAVQTNSVWIERRSVLLYCLAVFTPFAMLKNLTQFSIASFFSLMSIQILAITLPVYAGIYRRDFPRPPNPFPENIGTDFLTAVTSVSYLYVCHDLSFPVFMDFKDASRKRWRFVTLVVMTLTVITFMSAGYGGYFMFYENLDPNILVNFPAKDGIAIFLRCIISLTILISVPYMCFMPRFVMYAVFYLFAGKQHGKRVNMVLHVVTTIVTIASAVLIAELVTDLGSTISMIGAIAGCGQAYILPPLVYFRLESDSWYAPKKLLLLFILIFGLFMGVGSIVVNFM